MEFSSGDTIIEIKIRALQDELDQFLKNTTWISSTKIWFRKHTIDDISGKLITESNLNYTAFLKSLKKLYGQIFSQRFW